MTRCAALPILAGLVLATGCSGSPPGEGAPKSPDDLLSTMSSEGISPELCDMVKLACSDSSVSSTPACVELLDACGTAEVDSTPGFGIYAQVGVDLLKHARSPTELRTAPAILAKSPSWTLAINVVRMGTLSSRGLFTLL